MRHFSPDMSEEETRELMHRMVEEVDHLALFAVGHDGGQIQTYYGELTPEDIGWDDSPEMRALLTMMLTMAGVQANRTGQPTKFNRPELLQPQGEVDDLADG